MIPESDSTVEAGELIENIGLLGSRGTLEEKNELLRTMTEAVYLDLWANKSVVGIQPKPVFYPVLKSLQQNGKVIIFDLDEDVKQILLDRDEVVRDRVQRSPISRSSPLSAIA